VKVEVSQILNYIFDPTFGLVHIWPKFGLKQPRSVSVGVGLGFGWGLVAFNYA